jgi:hypothetical protein
MDKKKQHIIPQLHLKHFTGSSPTGHVWTYDAQTGSVRSSIPKETAVCAHFYSIENEDGTKDTKIEDFFSSVETLAAPIYQNLLQGILPKTSQEKHDFATFLALQYTRTPTMHRAVADIYGKGIQIQSFAYGKNEKSFNNLINEYEQDHGENISDERREKLRKSLIDPSGYEFHIHKNRVLQSTLNMAEKVEPLIFNMKWSILEAKHGFFITSDNPLIKRVSKGSSHPIYGDGGFANKTVEVTFPLSPELILFLSWKVSINGITPITHRIYVDDINQAIAAQSEQFLYSHVKHSKIQKMAVKFKDSKSTIIMDGFGPKKFAQVKVPRKWNK